MSKGFTLIELIIIVVVLGVLSAVVAPRFIDISSDAYLAKFNSAYGSFKTGMELANKKWRVKGSPTPENAIDLLNQLDFNAQGYPAGIDDGEQVSNGQDCVDLFEAVVDSSFKLEVPIGDGAGIKNLSDDVDIAVTINSNICYYTFVSESKDVGYNARQFRYYYTTGIIIEWSSGYTLR
ncbi:type II secretion system protein [Glaciecola petra]|uniref:Prepilin-type N-terminal cleavage/methylation domain-containing protein n=1 Tax=Glaciecola petra TaxID=3075602 RepID=A0ABU2ZRV4_9ALTE|nr:prepilin-type N-terminal cleavage/methylation domain-containing protein [Aestuariibacter sp. P117]MDT0595364.1 prepilin-type N-terminal cleavage/methylation domain-containing protein [Aestuariibacter sp. P117]